MDNYCDPFGFTKQTAVLLRGLGASELIPTCKKRNISTDILHQLSVQEFIILGADSKKAEEIKKALNIRRKSGVMVSSIQDRLNDFFEIITYGEQHLCSLSPFLTYWRLRLMTEKVNIYVNPDKCLSASNILPISIDATLLELENTLENLTELKELILGAKMKSKRNNILQLSILISGIGIITLALKTYLM